MTGTAPVIRPYPGHLEKEIETIAGRRFALRPIRPDDEAALIAMLGQCSRDDVRLRFFGYRKDFSHAFAVAMTSIDYEHEMAFVATERGGVEILGVVRLIADPGGTKAEFAVMVRSDLHGTGLGYSLMLEILAYARDRGIGSVFSDVLAENTTMLVMAAELGFRIVSRDYLSGVVAIRIDLTQTRDEVVSQ